MSAGGKGCGCHLIEQRLEQVVVAPVDQCDPAVRSAEGPDGRNPAEAATDHDDAGGALRDLLPAAVQNASRLNHSPVKGKLTWSTGGDQQQKQPDGRDALLRPKKSRKRPDDAQHDRNRPREHAQNETPQKEDQPPWGGQKLSGDRLWPLGGP